MLFPRAGGLYHFVKEAYGPLIGFLYGWTAFLVIMSGGNAAIAVAFGEYFGSFLPWFATGHILLSVPVGSWTWTLSGGQVAAVLALLLLTAVNHFGLKEGAWVQNTLTVIKIGSILAPDRPGPLREGAGDAQPLRVFGPESPAGSSPLSAWR